MESSHYQVQSAIHTDAVQSIVFYDSKAVNESSCPISYSAAPLWIDVTHIALGHLGKMELCAYVTFRLHTQDVKRCYQMENAACIQLSLTFHLWPKMFCSAPEDCFTPDWYKHISSA